MTVTNANVLRREDANLTQLKATLKNRQWGLHVDLTDPASTTNLGPIVAKDSNGKFHTFITDLDVQDRIDTAVAAIVAASTKWRDPVAGSANLGTISSPSLGDMTFTYSENELYKYNGSAWTSLYDFDKKVQLTNTVTADNILMVADFSTGTSYIKESPYTIPASDGTSGQVLTTNGSGTLSWNSIASGIFTATTYGGTKTVERWVLANDVAFRTDIYITDDTATYLNRFLYAGVQRSNFSLGEGYSEATPFTAVTTGTKNWSFNAAYTGGWSALTSGSRNIGFFESALNLITTGSENVAIGQQVFYSITTGSNNFGFAQGSGGGCGFNLTTGSHNFLIYSGSLTGGSGFTGQHNIGVGFDTFDGGGDGSSSYNIALGFENTKGASSAGSYNYNNSIGFQSTYSITLGDYNNTLAYKGLYSLLDGTHNVAIGFEPIYTLQSGTYNIGVGYRPLYNATGSAAHNIGIGTNASGDTTTGSYNICIGANAKTTGGSGSNTLSISSLSVDGDSTTSIIWGEMNTTTASQILYLNASVKITYGAQIRSSNELRFYDSQPSEGYVGFKAASTVSSNVSYTLPTADGTSGQVLSTNGSGVLSWSSATSQWTTSGSDIYYNTGKVGIGVTAPTGYLQVEKTVNGGAVTSAIVNLGTGASTSSALYFSNTSNLTGTAVGGIVYDHSNGVTSHFLQNSGTPKFVFETFAGADLLNISASETVVNEDSGDMDFRVESNALTHAFFVDGGTNYVGIGQVPTRDLDIYSGTTTTHIGWKTTGTGTTASDGLIIGIDASSNAELVNFENTDMIFKCNNVETGRWLAGAGLRSEASIVVKETSAPSSTSGYGKYYVSSTDSLAYFLSDDGTSWDLVEGAMIETCHISIVDTSGLDIGDDLPHYTAFWVSRGTKLTKAAFACLNYVSNTDFEVGIYNWAVSGNVTKQSSGTVTVTGAGKFEVTFSAAVTVTRGTLYLAAIFKNGVAANLIAARTGVSTSTAITFQGASVAGTNILPTTESTRNTSGRCPWVALY